MESIPYSKIEWLNLFIATVSLGYTLLQRLHGDVLYMSNRVGQIFLQPRLLHIQIFRVILRIFCRVTISRILMLPKFT